MISELSATMLLLSRELMWLYQYKRLPGAATRSPVPTSVLTTGNRTGKKTCIETRALVFHPHFLAIDGNGNQLYTAYDIICCYLQIVFTGLLCTKRDMESGGD